MMIRKVSSQRRLSNTSQSNIPNHISVTMRFATALTTLLPLALAAPGLLNQRQTPCAFPEYKTELVGDGDPHLNHYHIQLSVSH